MNKFLEGNFFNPSLGNIPISRVVNELVNYIKKKPDRFYEIVVGCDSSSGEKPYFPVVLVILRRGEGGRFFLKKINYQNRIFHSWKERILEEIMLSCQLALYVREKFEGKIKLMKDNFQYQFCYIHADVGENGATKDMVKEIIGLIKGNGFEAKIKPESFAASVVADRYT